MKTFINDSWIPLPNNMTVGTVFTPEYFGKGALPDEFWKEGQGAERVVVAQIASLQRGAVIGQTLHVVPLHDLAALPEGVHPENIPAVQLDADEENARAGMYEQYGKQIDLSYDAKVVHENVRGSSTQLVEPSDVHAMQITPFSSPLFIPKSAEPILRGFRLAARESGVNTYAIEALITDADEALRTRFPRVKDGWFPLAALRTQPA